MRSKRTLIVSRLAVTLGLVIAQLAVFTESASAGSGLRTFRLANSGISLSKTSYRYSNATGFWQTILNSNHCTCIVDGDFGNQTRDKTISFQTGHGLFASGAVGPSTWNYINDSQSVYGPRLDPTGIIDGYGTAYYSFYGGVDPSALLGWNPFGSQWMFNPYSSSSGSTGWPLYAAILSRNIGSFGICP